MWKLLIAYLMAFLMPGVDPDDTPPPDDDDTPPPDDDDDPDPEPAPRESRAQKTIRELRERAQKAEDDARRVQEELAAARRGPVPNAQPSEEQRIWEQEEAVLKNPEASDWQRYAIQANRSARAAQISSQNALQRSEDMADRAAFSQLAATKPKLHAAYKDRVETMLTEMRARGANAPREKLLAILVGEDMLSGKLKSSGERSTNKGGAARTPTPNARSDVSSSGGRMSEAEKRARRLENVRI